MKIVCLIDDPEILRVAAAFEAGVVESHYQREVNGNQYFAVVMGDGRTLDYLEAAGATIVEDNDPATSTASRQAGTLTTVPLAGETTRAFIKRATGGFDVRKFG